MWPRLVDIGLSSSVSELSELSGKLSSMLPFKIKVATCSQPFLSASHHTAHLTFLHRNSDTTEASADDD